MSLAMTLRDRDKDREKNNEREGERERLGSSGFSSLSAGSANTSNTTSTTNTTNTSTNTPNYSNYNCNNTSNNTANAAPSDVQIVQQLFAKAAGLIVAARTGSESESQSASSAKLKPISKPNKWFNIESFDRDPLRSELKFWKSQLAALSPTNSQSFRQQPSQQQQQQQQQLQPFFLDIYLDISQLSGSSQSLVLKDEISTRRQRFPPSALVGQSVDPITGTIFDVKKQRILLESWQLTLLPHPPNSVTAPPEIPIMYKKCVIFIRALYSYLRLLPAHRLFRRLEKERLKQVAKLGNNHDGEKIAPSNGGAAETVVGKEANSLGTSPIELKMGYRLNNSRVSPVDEAGFG
ncbi:autophagy protein 13 [Physocladia obscura]|uniref:Autophagy-related protein 13 n=1 Tax=Physocladia obscura TaxID=109957 RepID=A0AAD5SLM5_9FUNG|nr:autophagy protein 13 [Physocladia obscura]